MSDVFILNIDEQEQQILEPIAQTLETYDISTLCDTDVEYNEAGLAEIILKEITNCLVLAFIITESCFESLLSIFDLNANVIQNDNTTLLPILHNVDIDKAAQKYPFLLNCDYITYNENMDEVVSQIKTTVESLKDSTYIQNKIKDIITNLNKYENYKLNEIIVNLNDILELKTSPIIIKEIYNIIETLVIDIAQKENIYISENNLFKNIEKSGVIDKNIEEHIKYIAAMNRVYNSKSTSYETWKLQKDIDEAVNCLELTIDWYVVTYFKTSLIKYKKINPVFSDEITLEDLQDIYEIETLVFSEEIVGEADATRFSFTYNPSSIVGARDTTTGKIVAFINTYPITDKFHDKILSGDFDDTKVTTEDIMKYDSPGFYKLYVSSFCIHPKYNRTTAFGVVYKAFAQTIGNLAKEKGIYISDIIADCATNKGVLLCKNIGMKKHIDTTHGTMVYKLKLTKENLQEMKLLARQGSEVLNLYKEKYNS